MREAKERPIIFSGPMVRAILRDENPKTQTRRIVKPQPTWRDVAGAFASWVFKGGFLYPNSKPEILKLCPYGEPGDRLWVRETFCIETNFNMEPESSYPPPFQDGRPIRRHPGLHDWGPYWEQCHYRATDKTPELAYGDDGGYAEPTCRWRPSIHMPRWASRITLENAAVRVERLQDISEEDAIAEGIEQVEGSHKGAPLWRDYSPDGHHGLVSPILSYGSLWGVINGAGSWDANPWVWVNEFKRVVEAA